QERDDSQLAAVQSGVPEAVNAGFRLELQRDEVAARTADDDFRTRDLHAGDLLVRTVFREHKVDKSVRLPSRLSQVLTPLWLNRIPYPGRLPLLQWRQLWVILGRS